MASWVRNTRKAFYSGSFQKARLPGLPSRAQCTRAKSTPRHITLQPTREQQLALQAARDQQTSKRFWEIYSIRSGIEGTMGQAVEKLGMRRSRYRGIRKTHFQHLVTAAAINIQRMLSWFCETPRSITYQSHLINLATI